MVEDCPRHENGDYERDLDVRMLRHDHAPRFVSFARELVRAFPSPESLEEILGALRDGTE
jgi:hypothetical protein